LQDDPKPGTNMPESTIARFASRWEAEFAQGFLEDAGVPSRIADDSFGIGHAYVGGLAGASLVVAAERSAEARGLLEAAGVLETPQDLIDAPPPLADRPLPPVLRADFDDLTEQLRLARKAETRHAVSCVFGVTPAALVPLAGLVMEGNVALIVVLGVLVVFWEGWRWIEASKTVRRLESALAELDEETREL
jgi:hypothetical protein